MSLEYCDYTNIFSCDLMIELPKITNINEYPIELVEGK